MEADDPDYIRSLLDSSQEHACYFRVGDPCLGPVERIGVVPAMLMAHSSVFRRLLNPQESDLDERWDILMDKIDPRVFKNMLRFTYGFNAIKSYSIVEAMELLTLADKFVMRALEEKIISHIKTNLTPQNTCLALRYPVAVLNEDLEKEICDVIQTKSKLVFNCAEFYTICPTNMRHIVELGAHKISLLEVWRAVVKWARQKVLEKEVQPNVGVLEPQLQLKLIAPSVQHLRLCALSIISMVELHSVETAEDYEYTRFQCCHVVPSNPPRNVYICTHVTDDRYVLHELFKVKTLYDSSSWISACMKNHSEFIINTRNVTIEIHALVCTGIKKELASILFGIETLKSRGIDLLYNCRCTVTTILITNNDKEDKIVSKIDFKEDVFVNEEFKIVLNMDNRPLVLEPNNGYKFKITFTISHPLWFAHDIDDPTQDNTDIDIQYCAFDENLYGTHVKYVVYKCIG